VKVRRKADCYFPVSSLTIFYNKSIIDFQFACHLKVLGDVVLFFFRELRGWSVVGWEETVSISDLPGMDAVSSLETKVL